MQAELRETRLDFEHYYQMFYQEMYYVAKRIVYNHYSAEDVVQDAFLKGYRHFAHLNDQSKYRAWLRTIVIRTAIDYYRKQTKVLFVSLEEKEEIGQMLWCPNNDVEQQFELLQRKETIINMIDMLPKSMQEVMLLKLETDAKDQEIATRLNISLSAVKTRLHRARKLLNEMYQDQN